MTGFRTRAVVLRSCTGLVALTALAAVGVVMQGCPFLPPPPPPPPDPLVATATANATSAEVGTSVLLTGNATGGVSPYSVFQWLQTAGPTVTVVPASGAGQQVSISAAEAGVVTMQVSVQDSAGERVSATVSVTFTAAPPPVSTLAVTALASPSSVTLPAGATLSATVTPGVSPYTFFWLETSALGATLANAAAQSTAVTFPAAGTYTFTVTVNDSGGATATSAPVSVVVAPNPTPPTPTETLFTLNIDNLVGTTGDDIFSAPQVFATGIGLTATLQTGDQADGNGGNDTLNATIDLSVGDITPTLTAIGTWNVTNLGAGNQLVATNCTGMTNVNSVSSTALLDVEALQTLPAGFGLSNSTTGLTLTAIAASATASGTDATTLTLSGAKNTGGAEPTSTVTFNTAAASGIETLTINSIGSAGNEIDILATTGNTTSMTTLNVTGSQSLEIMDWSGGTTLPNSIVTIDASAMTAGNAVLRAGTGAVTFTGGPGDDAIYHGANYTTGDIIDGGTGTADAVGVTSALAAVAAAQSNVTNIEKLIITDAHTTTPVLTRWGAITAVQLEGGYTAGSITLPTDGTLTIGKKHTANVAGAGAGTFALSGATAGTANLALADADPAGLITVDNAATLNLSSSGNLNGNAAGGAANVITGGVTMSAAGSTTVNITGDTNLTAATVTASVVNAGTFNKNLTITITSGATLTTGGGDDTITGAAGNESISAGGGTDVITPAAGNDVVNGGDGNDTMTIGGVASGNDQATGGAGVDIFSIVGSTTAANNGLDVIVDFTPGTDKILLDKSDLALGGGAASPIAAGDFFKGAAAGMTAGTAYTVVVINDQGYANVGACEDAVAAASTSATGAIVIFFNSTAGEVQAYYDADIGTDDGLTDADRIFRFSNMTSTGAMTFTNVDFNMQA